MQEDNTGACLLEERCLIKISGAGAEGFLQNLVTNDVTLVAQDKAVYACLLTPQGRFLHDFFISRDAAGFFLECETQRREDLLRRLNIFKLRAKVKIEDCCHQFGVYTSDERPERVTAFQDPRLKALGYRFYLPKDDRGTGCVASSVYRDRRISLGVPEGSPDIKPEMDTIANVNLDCLNAISWDKGCYVGQEITAMTKNRGVAKRRMVIVSGDRLTAGDTLMQNGHAVGEIRAVHASMKEGLAILKLSGLDDLAGAILDSRGRTISARLPGWLKLKSA